EDGRRKTEDGRRKTEDGRRKTEDGRRKIEVIRLGCLKRVESQSQISNSPLHLFSPSRPLFSDFFRREE
ncbi:MAG: hypothetical protein JXR66_13525, partial [Bacteroidales bacterium]|nr:hypothetical protein [Bacteroidales bacterium]